MIPQRKTRIISFWLGRVTKALTQTKFEFEFYNSTCDEGPWRLWDADSRTSSAELPVILCYGNNFLKKNNQMKTSILERIKKSWDEISLLDSL
jgi:hypothetical protein